MSNISYKVYWTLFVQLRHQTEYFVKCSCRSIQAEKFERMVAIKICAKCPFFKMNSLFYQSCRRPRIFIAKGVSVFPKGEVFSCEFCEIFKAIFLSNTSNYFCSCSWNFGTRKTLNNFRSVWYIFNFTQYEDNSGRGLPWPFSFDFP